MSEKWGKDLDSRELNASIFWVDSFSFMFQRGAKIKVSFQKEIHVDR
jgi:hypothetical protein